MFFSCNRLLRLICCAFMCVFVLVCSVYTACAQEQDESAPQDKSATWSISLGGGVLIAPEFEGAKRNSVRFMPLIEARAMDRFFLSSHEGLGVYLIKQSQWQLGAVAKYNFGRKENASTLLHGLGDIDPGAELGVFAAWTPDPFFVKVTALQGTGDVRGFQVQTQVGHTAKLHEKVRWTNSLGATFANARRNNTFFGISREQSRNTAYEAYDAGSGIKDISLSTSLGWSLTDDIALRAFGGYKRLTGPAADSPLVKAGSKNQFVGGCGLVYTFSSGK